MHFESLDKMFVGAIKDCKFSGNRLSSRDGDCVEVLGWYGTLDDPTRCFTWNPQRKFNPSYASGELFWYLSGSDSGEFIKHYAPSYYRFLEDNGRANGAYGARWIENGGLQRLVQLLETDPNTRQAILAMWGPRDLPSAYAHDKRDIPCTLSLQFLVRNETLYCVCTMRSNDAWLGLPNDVFAFCQLQCLIAEYLGLKIGWYRHQVGSMHLYMRDAEKADAAISIDRYPTYNSPEMHRPFTTGAWPFHGALNDAYWLERTVRSGDIDRFNKCLKHAPLTRFTVLAAMAACTTLKRSGGSTSVIKEVLNQETLEACRITT